MINIGIIGAGRIGQVHAKSILTGVPQARILAIADPYLSEQAEKWAQSVGIEGIYRDHHKILDDPRIDAVLICSSTDTHAPISLEAIRAGKHVFCEKPIDHSLQKIAEVQAALAASPKNCATRSASTAALTTTIAPCATPLPMAASASCNSCASALETRSRRRPAMSRFPAASSWT